MGWYTIAVWNKPTRWTQPCIPLVSLNWLLALLEENQVCHLCRVVSRDPICEMWVPKAVRIVVCGMPCHHISDREWTINILWNQGGNDVCLGCILLCFTYLLTYCCTTTDYKHAEETCSHLDSEDCGGCYGLAVQQVSHPRHMASHWYNGNGSLEALMISAALESPHVHSSVVPDIRCISLPSQLSA